MHLYTLITLGIVTTFTVAAFISSYRGVRRDGFNHQEALLGASIVAVIVLIAGITIGAIPAALVWLVLFLK